MRKIVSSLPPSAVIDLPNGTTLVAREIDELLYLDAISVLNGSAVPLQLDEQAESTLSAILENRRQRRRALGSPKRPR